MIPEVQPIRVDDEIHYMRPLQMFGVVTQAEIERDWTTYQMLQQRATGALELPPDEEAMFGRLHAIAPAVRTDTEAMLYDLLLQRRRALGTTLTDDEALLGDLASDRILRLAIPTLTADQYAAIDAADRQGLMALFLEITAATAIKMRARREQAPKRSILQKLAPN